MKKSLRTALTLGAAAGLAAAAVAAPAAAAPSAKGSTTIVPSATTLSVFEGVLRPGSLDASVPSVTYGITGNPASGTVRHVGGLAIDGSAGILGDSFLEIRNFWIDTNAGTVSGDVEGVGRAVLFTLDNVAVSNGGKTITATLEFTDLASQAAIGSTAISGTSAGTATVSLR
jgi:hypothetical protein